MGLMGKQGSARLFVRFTVHSDGYFAPTPFLFSGGVFYPSIYSSHRAWTSTVGFCGRDQDNRVRRVLIKQTHRHKPMLRPNKSNGFERVHRGKHSSLFMLSTHCLAPCAVLPCASPSLPAPSWHREDSQPPHKRKAHHLATPPEYCRKTSL